MLPIKVPSVDDVKWMNTRGEVRLNTGGGHWRIESKCKHLTWRGRCRVYDNRPVGCMEFAPGSKECIAAREYFGVKDKQKGGE
jgi:Fe-S-cluster containining protein